MKSYLLVLSIVLFAASCSNSPKNKIEGTDSQAIADGSGEQLVVDTQASSIHWVGTKPGGSHHGTIGIKEGSLAINGTDVASGSFIIDMNAIVDEDLTDQKMNEMLVTHLKSADFFDVEKYPTSSFAITKVEAVTGNDSITHRISGNLKMKDVEKNITFDAKITKEGDAYKAVTIPFTIDRTQWNVQYGSKSIFADLKDKFIDDNIELQITIIAKAAK
ncbi:YceI family protein [Dysgonomonas sp. HDW5B]|uniref:YceI family protein n=1 Tax=Dysgonomonas sp. HDW5B TaxID=2714927 RepID=UPI0014097A94|nr:YceI family protein [Dysgonomonas sp. HDW5B]QIK53417.1 YceI family protein [Dysgonomonas sp. HDW5B]